MRLTTVSGAAVVMCRADLGWVLVGIVIVAAPSVRGVGRLIAPIAVVASIIVPELLGNPGTWDPDDGHLGTGLMGRGAPPVVRGVCSGGRRLAPDPRVLAPSRGLPPRSPPPLGARARRGRASGAVVVVERHASPLVPLRRPVHATGDRWCTRRAPQRTNLVRPRGCASRRRRHRGCPVTGPLSPNAPVAPAGG